MKKVVIFLVLVSLFGYDSYSQDGQSLSKSEYRDITSWTVSVGVNAVGNLGTQGPLNNIGSFEFRQPLSLAIQHRWSRFFGVEQDFTLNKFGIGSIIDGGILTEEFTYFSTNTSFKYYFSDEFLPNTPWIDVYTGAGLGIFKIDKVSGSFNLLLGGILWATPSIGFGLQGVTKFSFTQKSTRYETNHFQYMLSAVFKL